MCGGARIRVRWPHRAASTGGGGHRGDGGAPTLDARPRRALRGAHARLRCRRSAPAVAPAAPPARRAQGEAPALHHVHGADPQRDGQAAHRRVLRDAPIPGEGMFGGATGRVQPAQLGTEQPVNSHLCHHCAVRPADPRDSQMFGGSAPARDTTAPAANGFALCALSESPRAAAAVPSCHASCARDHSGTSAPADGSADGSCDRNCRRPCRRRLAVYAFANVSGGHLNPAVSFALMCTGHMKW